MYYSEFIACALLLAPRKLSTKLASNDAVIKTSSAAAVSHVNYDNSDSEGEGNGFNNGRDASKSNSVDDASGSGSKKTQRNISLSSPNK